VPWRAVIAVLREKGLPRMPEHATVIEEQLERHGPRPALLQIGQSHQSLQGYQDSHGGGGSCPKTPGSPLPSQAQHPATSVVDGSHVGCSQ